MKKTIHSPESKAVCAKLVAMRMAAGLTHRQLAEKLGREVSFVWRIEHGERRVDVVEFFQICRILKQDPSKIYGQLAMAFAVIDDDSNKR